MCKRMWGEGLPFCVVRGGVPRSGQYRRRRTIAEFPMFE